MHCLRVALSLAAVASASQPHIVLMVLDDVGWSDVGYHGSDFPTPTIDRLATSEGVRLERYYVQQVCSPTRSSLMTSRYPFRIGMQHFTTLMPGSTAAIPLDAPTIAEVLKEKGYSTHAIGKWHLGYAKWQNTPTGRGFDSHLGYLQGACDYYNKTIGAKTVADKVPFIDKIKPSGFDFWRDQTAVWDEMAGPDKPIHYTVDLYQQRAKEIIADHDPSQPMFLYFAHQNVHQPLQYPPEQKYKDVCNHVAHTDILTHDRHTLCAMMARLDDAIGEFESELKSKGMWNNTVFWVTTDNGGMLPHGGFRGAAGSVSSNFPLRSGKTTLFEGGVRAVSFVTGGLVPEHARASSVTGLLQHVDVPTTLVALAGASLSGQDGFNVWNTITEGVPSPRLEVPLNVDRSFKGKISSILATGADFTNMQGLIQGKWKLILGQAGMYDGWSSNDPYSIEKPDKRAKEHRAAGHEVWLFDLDADPQERNNVAREHSDIVKSMIDRLEALGQEENGYVAPQPNKQHKQAAPKLHNGTWAPFLSDDEVLPEEAEDEIAV